MWFPGKQVEGQGGRRNNIQKEEGGIEEDGFLVNGSSTKCYSTHDFSHVKNIYMFEVQRHYDYYQDKSTQQNPHKFIKVEL